MKRDVKVVVTDFWLDTESVVASKFKVKIKIKFPDHKAIYRTITV